MERGQGESQVSQVSQVEINYWHRDRETEREREGRVRGKQVEREADMPRVRKTGRARERETTTAKQQCNGVWSRTQSELIVSAKEPWLGQLTGGS